ncbi:MAG TPA: hypothetical protein ENN03_02210 [bacterium]|nr:hypothetical protein [bacterium]
MNRKRSFIALAILFPLLTAAQSVYLPLDHWAYDYFERMHVKGLLEYTSMFPVSRIEAAAYTETLDSLAQLGRLSSLEQRRLERLKGFLWDEIEVPKKQSEREPNLVRWYGERASFYGDALAGFEMEFQDQKPRQRFRPYYGGAVRGRAGSVGFYSDNRILTEWGAGPYVQNYDPSLGYPMNAEKDSSRATWDTSHSYLVIDWRPLRFVAGRHQFRWGPAIRYPLMVSGHSAAFDMIMLETYLGRSRFMWFHGGLRGREEPKWFAGHRLELRWNQWVLGIQESVVYGNRGMEPAYLNPVLPCLIAEHTLGDRDNIALGLDIRFRPVNRLQLHTEFFVDDLNAPWDIFNDYWGNKLAWLLGGIWIDPLGIRDSDFSFEFVHIDPFVYTHHRPVNVYEHYDKGLGAQLQPNSEALYIRWRFRPVFPLLCSVAYEKTRKGEGDRRTPHSDADGERKRFLVGSVETEHGLTARLDLEIRKELFLSLEVARRLISQEGIMEGSNHQIHSVFMSLDFDW